ncbi:hypothetical protein [Secundilactobacillus muriivasis]
MNYNDFTQIIIHKRWQLEAFHTTWQTITMGRNRGKLILVFHTDGTLSFPTNMLFLPQFTRWTFNEQGQVLELRNDQNELLLTFTLPEIADNNQYLYLTDRSQRLVNFTYVDPIFDLPITPIPTYDAPRHTYSGTSPFILQLGSQPELATNAADWGLTIEQLTPSNDPLTTWQHVYQFLLDQFNLQQVAIINGNHQLQAYPFEDCQPNTLYLLDKPELTPIILADGQSTEVQVLDPSVLIGPRFLLLELLSNIIVRADHQRITLDRELTEAELLTCFNQAIYQDFSSRTWHGQLVRNWIKSIG